MSEVPWQVMNQIRSDIRDLIGQNAYIEEDFFTYDYSRGEIVCNKKISGWHLIFDLEGNILRDKCHREF